jgi:riboflavin synthase
MFTGLVENVGALKARVASGGAGKLTVEPSRRFAKLVRGESVAVNGACLTLETELPDGSLVFHTLAETLKRTNLGLLKLGSKVNLERALALGDRLGGHIVQGHVDCVATLISIGKAGSDIELAVELPPQLAPLVIEKGSVAIDGVSLTVVDLSASGFSVRLIPTTWNDTALRFRKAGDKVNLEADLLGRYVLRQLQLSGDARAAWASAASKPSSVGMDTLERAGFV